jgi:hypothetical protein
VSCDSYPRKPGPTAPLSISFSHVFAPWRRRLRSPHPPSVLPAPPLLVAQLSLENLRIPIPCSRLAAQWRSLTSGCRSGRFRLCPQTLAMRQVLSGSAASSVKWPFPRPWNHDLCDLAAFQNYSWAVVLPSMEQLGVSAWPWISSTSASTRYKSQHTNHIPNHGCCISIHKVGISEA